MSNPENKRALFDGELAYKTDLDRPGDTLFVTFGGLAQGIVVPPFDFHRIVKDLPVKLAFFRDVSQTWYHGDLPGIGSGIRSVAAKIEELKAECGAKRVVLVGNSMGAYAGLVVGDLIQADEVIAFAPQTFLTRWLRFRFGDRRAKNEIANLRRVGESIKGSLDLMNYFTTPGYKRARIYADRTHKIDYDHAMRIADKANTETHWVEEGAHAMIKKLHRKGEFKRILASACEAD
ncbi:MAG: pimeloyl-ACP methyl ester carboxylesterase [Planctomycetota bacterium]|jgi:pimeloyl-ACP methyl ester carboxylesterase